MAIPMRTQMTRTLLAWLSVGVGIVGLVSCSAAEDGPRGPVENVPGRHTATTASSASAKPMAGPQDVQALPCGARPMRYLGDLPPRALSQRVPDRACSDDSECGDGFCDRGRCAPIWEDWYGQRCS